MFSSSKENSDKPIFIYKVMDVNSLYRKLQACAEKEGETRTFLWAIRENAVGGLTIQAIQYSKDTNSWKKLDENRLTLTDKGWESNNTFVKPQQASHPKPELFAAQLNSLLKSLIFSPEHRVIPSKDEASDKVGFASYRVQTETKMQTLTSSMQALQVNALQPKTESKQAQTQDPQQIGTLFDLVKGRRITPSGSKAGYSRMELGKNYDEVAIFLKSLGYKNDDFERSTTSKTGILFPTSGKLDAAIQQSQASALYVHISSVTNNVNTTFQPGSSVPSAPDLDAANKVQITSNTK